MKLTHTIIEAIEPPATGQVEYRDDTCRGLILRVSQGGAKTWLVRYLKSGKRRRFSLGRWPELGLADARIAAKKQIGDVAGGGDPAKARAEAKREPTFAEVAQVYLDRHAVNKRHRGLQSDVSMLRLDLLPAWGHWKITDIERRHIVALLDKIVDRGAPASANRTKALISMIFRFAEDRALVRYNPAVRLAAPAPKRSRERFLSEDELRRLFESLKDEPSRRQAIVLTTLLTAVRKGEVLGMKWSEIDNDWWTMPGTRTKNSKEHRLFLTPSVMAAINALPRDGEFVFHGGFNRKRLGYSVSDVSNWFQRVLARAGIEGFVFHDLRRTAATHMNRVGIDPVIVERILNHVQSGVAGVYNRYAYDAEKRRALLRWERELDNIISVGEKAAGKVVELHA